MRLHSVLTLGSDHSTGSYKALSRQFGFSRRLRGGLGTSHLRRSSARAMYCDAIVINSQLESYTTVGSEKAIEEGGTTERSPTLRMFCARK